MHKEEEQMPSFSCEVFRLGSTVEDQEAVSLSSLLAATWLGSGRGSQP